jgi:hypothetical protein
MQKFGYILGFGTLYLVAEFIIFSQNSELSRLKTENMLVKSQIEIMRDENNDIYRTMSSARTYEDGVRDGVENSKSIEWTNGYHAAISQNSCDNTQYTNAVSEGTEQ